MHIFYRKFYVNGETNILCQQKLHKCCVVNTVMQVFQVKKGSESPSSPTHQSRMSKPYFELSVFDFKAYVLWR